MSNNIFNPDFKEFLELLVLHEVGFLLVGGYAVILHGYVRSTGDIDLWLDKTEENYFKLEKVYTAFHAPIFSLEEFFDVNFDVWSIGITPSKIEILSKVDGLEFKESYENRSTTMVDEIKIPYINYNDLIKNKLSTGRYKDLADVEQLKKIKK